MMKTLRAAGMFLLAAVAALTGLATYVKLALPDVGKAPALHIAHTPQQVARGAYLANYVCMCMDCHSQRDWKYYSGPVVKGTLGMGGEVFSKDFGFPGDFYASNITPHNLSRWTDGEIFRAITSGVSKDGRALFTIMPYRHYGKMDTADLFSIIAYLRTLKSISHNPPPSHPDFPMSLLVNTLPQKSTLQQLPPTAEDVSYGEYLTNAAACYDCHTPFANGEYKKEMAFAGGFEFRTPRGLLRSPNITFDKSTGIGMWSRNVFIRRFKLYADSVNHYIPLRANTLNTVMPWTMYAGMTENDLGAIYAYLSSLPVIAHRVKRFEFGQTQYP